MKPLAGKVHLPIVWEPVKDKVWRGKITEDLFFVFDDSGRTGKLYTPENFLKPMRCEDRHDAVDAANAIALEHWHEIIRKHLTNRKNPLSEKTFVLSEADYQLLLQATKQQLIDRFMQAGRIK